MENHQLPSQKNSTTLEKTSEGNYNSNSTKTWEQEETGTFHIKQEVFEEDWSSDNSLPDKSRENTGMPDVKVELSEEDCSTVSRSAKSREDTGRLDEQDCSMTSSTLMSYLADDQRKDTGTLDIKIIKVESLADNSCTITPIMSGIDNAVASDNVDIKVEAPEEDSSTNPVTPIISGIDNAVASDNVDIKVEAPEEDSSTNPVTPIISGIDNAVGSDNVDIKVETPEEDSSTNPVTPIISGINKAEASDNVDIKVETPEADSSTNPVTPIISGIDNAVGSDTVDIKVEIPEEDSSTVPVTPIISCIDSPVDSAALEMKVEISEPHILCTDKPEDTSKQDPAKKKAKKLTKAKRKENKRAALIAHGVPEKIAKLLCMLPLPDILKRFPSLKFPIQPNQESRTPVMNNPKSASIGADKPSFMELAQNNIPSTGTNEELSVNSKGLSRVGIQNTKPMNKAQMTMVHRHLVLAITELGKGGSGPEFLDFQQMDGWVMVTCVDHRSRIWLVDQLKHLKLWPGARLSIIPEQKLPKQVIAYIPESEATDVQEALALLKAQNTGLNTEQWKILNERLFVGKSWSILFIIDELSLETLRAQNCKAAIGFKRMSFKIVNVAGIPSDNYKSQLSKNQGLTSFQGNKGSNQKPRLSSAAGYEMPVGTGHPYESQNFISQDKSQSAQREKGGAIVTKRVESSYLVAGNRKLDGEKNSYALSSRPIYYKEPSTLTAAGRPIPKAGGDAQSVIEDSRTENSPGPSKGKPKIISVEHIFHQAKKRIKELRQKTQTKEHTTSEQNGSQSITTSRWDEPPIQTGRKRPLEARDRDIALPIIDYSKRQREETSTASQTTRGNISMMPQRVQCITSSVGAPAVVTLGRSGTGGITVSQQNMFSAQTIGGDPNMVPAGSCAPTAVIMGSGTGGITVTQQNVFSAQTTMGNIAMAPPMVIPGYCGPTVVNLATSGTEGIAVTPQNIPMVPQSLVYPGYVAPTVVNLATGAGAITVPSQSEIQAMDYFLGPGGGSQFIQNQMMSQNSLSYGAVPHQTALAATTTMYPMYQYSNQYTNCYQAPQNGMSTFNKDNSQESSLIAPIYKDIDESKASRDSNDSRTREDSEEGFYSSWIIQDAESFAASTAKNNNPLNSAAGQMSPQTTGRFGTQKNEGPNIYGIPSSAQDSDRLYVDTHSRSFKERVPPQDRDYEPYDRNSPSILYSRRSRQAKSGRTQDLGDENYESSASKDRSGVTEVRKSPQARSGYNAWIIEDPGNYGRRKLGREERDVTDIPDRTSQLAGSKSGYCNLVVQDADRRFDDTKHLFIEDAGSSDRSRSSGRERERLRTDRGSPERTSYKRGTQDAISRDTVLGFSSKAQRPRESYGYIRNNGEEFRREPTRHPDRSEVQPRR